MTDTEREAQIRRARHEDQLVRLLKEARGEIAQLKSTMRAEMTVELIEEMGRLRDEIACLRRTLVPTPPDSPSPLVSDATMFDEVRNPIR